MTHRVASVFTIVLFLATACSSSPPGVSGQSTDGPSSLGPTSVPTLVPSSQPTAVSSPDPTSAPVESDEGHVDGTTSDTDPEPELALDGTAETPILVDQFGYLPAAVKVAVIVDPQLGFNSSNDFEPGTRYTVRNSATSEIVFEASPTVWNGGAVHQQSGDRGWWFDFSEVTDPGTYVVVDEEMQVTSAAFDIGPNVYDDVLDAALRAFYLNRLNVAHPPELAGVWSDGAAFVGAGQDYEVRAVDDRDNPASARDLHGGWADAGDSNKYVTFAADPVHQLLAAYRIHPYLFDDEVGIPESGNGIPDIVDEVLWELDWLTRMQDVDGGVFIKMGQLGFGKEGQPSEDTTPRFYEEKCSSAAIAASGMFAHGAIVVGEIAGLAEVAADFERRALAAWQWAEDNPLRDDCDPQEVKAGDADMSVDRQRQVRVASAIWLFGLTGQDRFDAVVGAEIETTNPFGDPGFGRYLPQQAEAVMFYFTLDNANPAVVDQIRARLDEVTATDFHGFDPEASLYRAFMPDAQYHWGSNRVKANYGSSNAAVAALRGADAAGGEAMTERAGAHLHWLHGINPLGLVYLSNMGDLGAERSITELFHYWFAEGTPWADTETSEFGPPPGYVVGGPNRQYGGSLLQGEPPQKTYVDSGSLGNGEPVWELSEPAIYYQSAYIRLLAWNMAPGVDG